MGSMSTLNELQQLYLLKQTAAMRPYLNQTVNKMSDMGGSVVSSYRPVANWNNYVNDRYVAPANYELGETLKNIQHSNERFSFGRNVREAQARVATDSKINQLIAADVAQERQNQMSGQEQGYMRQLQALAAFGNASQTPLSVQGQENYVKQGLF